jgi:hypothetical protein
MDAAHLHHQSERQMAPAAIHYPAASRGRTRIDWLDSRHSFSFGGYHEPTRQRFRSLRVLNDDVVAPASGFGTHPHRDMEIISWVISGQLQHRDSTGGGGVLTPGGIQVMSAGTGIAHSEWNPSEAEPVRFLQLWILPDRNGHAPGWREGRTPVHEQPGILHAVAGRGTTLPLQQEVVISAAVLRPDQVVETVVAAGRGVWLQVARGSVSVNGRSLAEGDGVGLGDPGALRLANSGPNDSEFLLIDMA